jgi:hypothetical protein
MELYICTVYLNLLFLIVCEPEYGLEYAKTCYIKQSRILLCSDCYQLCVLSYWVTQHDVTRQNFLSSLIVFSQPNDFPDRL